MTTEEIYFSGKRVIEDFLTLKGIERKIGVGRKDVYTFILKELLDNALDYSENQEEPMIRVDLEILPGGENVKVVVSNSNDSNNPAFTEQRLKSVFNFKDMVSSKRNLFRITRGALGDAFKHIIGIPYALADDLHIEITQAPLIIHTKGKIYTVSLVVDRRTGLVNADVVESQAIHDQGKDDYIAANDFTKIELLLPIIDGFSLGRLQTYLCDYTIFNTHVYFRFKLTDIKGQVYNDHYQQTQPTTTTKNNAVVTSIHWYSKEEFHQLINALDNGDRQVYDVIKLFRESSNMGHDIKFDNMLIVNLTSDLVDELYQKLIHAIKTAPTSLALQFNTNKTVRGAALKKRLEQRYGKISNVKFKSVSAITGVGRDKFPYYFEITICTVDALTSNLILIDTINSSMAPGSHTYLKGDEHTFYWITAKMQRYTTNHIIRLLENYQYSYEIQKGKKKKSVVMINLVTPNKIHFKNYGKSDIDVQPFADAISECTVKCCKGGATQQDRKSQIDCMREILTDRRVEIQRSREDILRRKSWVRSTAFYNCRKLMLENGYTAEEINRDTVTGYIEQICEEWRITREELGIFAADRAQLHFKGVTYDVSYDDIKELAKKGAYMVAIEKEGAGVQFYRYADYFGIVLLNSRGFLVDYAKRLLKDAVEEGFGCRIAILTDFDIPGLLIASKAPDVIRIGVGFEIIEWLQQNGYPNLTQEDVEEPYTPKEFSEEVLERLDATEEELEYLKGNRIEIDSILAVLNDNGKIWEYILYKLSENFENANYNRSIFTPDHVISEAQESLNKMVEKLGIRVTRDNRTKLWSKYIEYQGFLNISAEEKTNTNALKQKEETDYHMKPILDDIAEVVKKHTDRVNTVVDEYDAFKVYQEVDQYDMSGIYDIAINMKAYEVQCPFEILSIRESITSIIESGPCG